MRSDADGQAAPRPVWYTPAHLTATVQLRIGSGLSIADLDVAIAVPLLEAITLTVSEAGDPASLRITLPPPERHRIRLARRADKGALEKGIDA